MPKRKARIALIGGGTFDRDILLALNASTLPEGCELVALNFEMPGDGSVPEWLPLIPSGDRVTGRDGRSWINDRPEGILNFFAQDAADIPLDWEHATHLKAPQGEPAPAAGWIKELQLREGAIWGRFDWTPRGRASVENREYRYLSPALIFEKSSNRILNIASVGLVNKPNFKLAALNRQQPQVEEAPPMLKKLLAKLGLPETADEATALNAIVQLQGDLSTALNRADTPSLDRFVPRADYDAALNRAATSETALAEVKKADLELAINATVDAAVVAGKVTPGTKDYYVGMCRQDGGLDAFRKFVEAAPVVGKGSDLDGKSPAAGETALNAEEKKIAEMFGNSADDLKKYGAA
jgi:phage I-like protein